MADIGGLRRLAEFIRRRNAVDGEMPKRLGGRRLSGMSANSLP